MYSAQVMDHFQQPRNQGQLAEPHGVGRCQNPVCGDEAEIFVEVREDVITDIRFQAVGCVAALAACSCLTELVRGRSPADAAGVTVDDLLQELGGLPRSKRHGAALAVDTLQQALRGTPDRPILFFGGKKV